MSTNLEYWAREKQRKRESRRQASKAQREKKNKGAIFLLEEQRENFVAALTKQEMLEATNARWTWAAVKKKVEGNTYDISSKKRVTKMFLEVSRCSREKQRQILRQKNVQKKNVLHVQSCCFAN